MSTPRSRNAPEPTWVSQVEEALARADDFMSFADLLQAVGAGCTHNRLTAALHSLRKYKAADSVESGGKLYWFSTPDTDTRVRHYDMRRPEEPGTRRRRSKTHAQP